MNSLTQTIGLLSMIVIIMLSDITVLAHNQDSIPIVNAQPIVSDSLVQLREVVVNAANIIRKKDRFILFPSKDTKAISNNAIELIGNMHLPGVFLDNRTDNLSSVRDGNIGYRINGAPASALDFRAINPQNIRKIDYITSPGMRYGNVVVVLDIYTVRPDVGISGNFSARQSINQGKGIYRSSLKANYKKSEFTLSANYEYGRFSDSKMTNTSTFLFENGDILKRINENNPYTQKEDYLQTFASYSYMDKRNLFLAKLCFTQFLIPETNISSNVHESRLESETKEYVTENMRSKDLKPEFNLYYQHEFDSKGILILDAVFNNIRIHNDDEKYYFIDNDISNSILTNGFGEKYSAISQLQYIQPIRKGNFSFGLKHIWSKNRNEYTGTVNSTSKQTRRSYEMFAEWSGSIRRFNYTVGIQGQHVSYSQNKDKIKEWNIEPKLRLTYDATDNLSFSFNGKSDMFGSGLGNSSTIVYQDDKFRYIAGNSELKPQKSYYGALSSTLFTRNYFGDIDFSYERRESPLMQDIFRYQGHFVTTTINGKHADILNISHASRIRLFNRNLTISPRFGYRYSHWVCNSYANSIHTWWFKGGVSYSLKKFNFSVDYYKDADVLNYGFSKRTIQQMILFGVSYHIKSWKFLANLRRPLNDDVYTLETNSEYISNTKTFYQRGKTPIVSIQVSWNFSKNKTNPHKEKRINNVDNDNGML